MNERDRCQDGEEVREAGHYSPRCMLEQGHDGRHVNGLFCWETGQFATYAQRDHHA